MKSKFGSNVLRLFLLCALVASPAAMLASAGAKVSAAAVEASGSAQGGVAQATFKIAVTNDEASSITNVSVVFTDDTTVAVGDVDAGKTGVSQAVTRTINLSDQPSNNSAFRVTLRFNLNGEAVEVPATLTLKQ